MIKLTPPKITPYWLNEDRKLCDIIAHNKILGDLTLNTKYYPDVTERFITELRNKDEKILDMSFSPLKILATIYLVIA